jgi:4-hydroxybenzoate polyprenyltransferase
MSVLSMPSRRVYWRDLLRVHRLEYPFPVNYLCHASWGAAFAVSRPRELLDLPVLAAIAAAVLPLVSQNLINAAYDVRADAVNPGKKHLGEATLRLGRSRVLRWFAVETVLALTLATAASVSAGRPWVLAAVATSVVLWLLYNLEPVRLKRRSFINPVSYALTFVLLPCVSSYSAVRPDFPWWVWTTWSGMGVLLIARTLWWSIPDRGADASVGDRTPVVAHGARRALAIACVMTAAGVGVTGWGLWQGYGPLWSLLYVVAATLFLVDKLGLLRRISDDDLPHEKRMRTHSLTVVMVSDVLLVLIPLLAGP